MHTGRVLLEEIEKGRLGEMSGMTQVPAPADHQSPGLLGHEGGNWNWHVSLSAPKRLC